MSGHEEHGEGHGGGHAKPAEGHAAEEHAHAEHKGGGGHYHDERWDDKNKPVGYIIGASPGYAQFGQGEEKLINMGLARKIVKASRMGFDFAMIDYEALSEMYEADIKEQIAHIKETQGDISSGRKFEVGIHMAVEMDLCISNAYEWKIMHEKLTKGAYSSRKLVEAKFALFHTSSRIRPHVTFKVGQQEPRVAQVSHDGLNLGSFIDTFDAGKYEDPARGKISMPSKTPSGGGFRGMRDWFIAKFINVMFNAMGAPGDVGTIHYFDELMLIRHGTGYQQGVDELKTREQNFQQKLTARVQGKVDEMKSGIIHEIVKVSEQIRQLQAQNISTLPLQEKLKHLEAQRDSIESVTTREYLRDQILRDDADLERELKEIQTTAYYALRHDFHKIFDFWVRHGSQCEEEVSYKVIAKYMWLTGDPLWKDLVGTEYDPDQIIWKADLGEEYYDKAKEKKVKTMELVEKMITAVAAKYIQGHLLTKNPIWSMKTEDKELKSEMSVYDYLKEGKVQIFIETAMPPQGQEGQLRIMSAHDHVLLVKHLDDGRYTSYCMDFEHLTDNYIPPDKDIATLKEGWGKYINIMHINAPRPIMGAHAPLEPLSRDMVIVYKWLHELRKKGMKNCYFIWEMGSYGSKQSAIAFRELVRQLSLDTPWDKLPPEFYGLDRTFEAQQLVNMREHAYDILEGMTATPEETHGMLSTEAAKKGKLSEWLKGRAR